MKQKTAIIRALKQRYDVKSVSFSKTTVKGDGFVFGHPGDFFTVDHGGHSTRVYNRHIFVSTIYGTVTI